MPIKVDDPRDIQSAYDNRLTPQTLHQAETQPDGSHDNIPDYDRANDGLDAYEKDFDASKTLDKAEGNTSGGWSTNVQGAANNANSLVDKLKKINFKRAAPIGGVIGLLISMAGLISFFGGPGLLIVNLAEVMTEKFNYQLGSLDARHQKILQAKLNNTTTGLCTKVTVRCKYATFSDKEIKNFEKAGLKVETDGKSTLGRNKIKSFTMEDGTVISPKNFTNEMAKGGKFNTAMKKAYNMKYSGLSDKIFNKTSVELKVSKKAPFDEGSTDEQRASTVEETTKNGKGNVDAETNKSCKGDTCTTDEQKAQEADNTKNASTGENLAENSAKSETNVANEIIDEESDSIEKGIASAATGTAAKSVTSIIKVTGALDNACMVYGWVKTISYTAKVVRMAQMARYAMIFLTTASMIKAGTAKPDDVSYLGNILTKITVNSKNQTTKAATDSFGYRYAAFGDSGINTIASTAIAGASFGTKIQSTIDAVLNILRTEGNPDKLCHFLSNTAVQIVSGVIGVASFFFGVGEAKLTVQAAIAPLIAIAGAILPAMIGDILAGRLVDDKTYGERAGNLITSGSGGLMSKISTRGGNAILKRSDAKAYMQLQRETELSYAKFERDTTSPFDATNPNTFLGSIYASAAPYLYSSQTPLGAVGSVVSVMASATSNVLIPRSFAASQESYAECSDPSYAQLDMATDPFCNPVVGIPPKYLGEDPNVINDRLLTKGLIDEMTGEAIPDSSYDKFIKNCIQRTDPFGSSQDGEVDTSNECFIDNQDEADMYIHYVDQRSLDITENGLPASTGGESSSTSSVDSTNATITDPPNKNGWSKPINAAAGFGWHQNGSRGLHKGVDFLASIGTPVTAAHDGTVSTIRNMGSCGWATVITAEGVNGIWQGYQHMNPLGSLKVGDTVKRGQVIGQVGTFCGTGYHLHFSIETANRVSAYADSGASDTSKNPADWIPM